MTTADLATVNRLFDHLSTAGELDMRKRAAARCRELANVAKTPEAGAAYRDCAMEIEKLMPVKP